MTALTSHGQQSRRWPLVAALLLCLVLAAQMAGASLPASPSSSILDSFDSALREVGDGVAKIIVRKWNPDDYEPERAVKRLGGRITHELPIIDGFSASVPASSVDSLDEISGARTITLDRRVNVQETAGSEPLRSVYPKVVNANRMWTSGYKGAGVTVALIDTGVADVADISGRVLPVYDDIMGTWSPCQNLSGEPNCRDSYGHGTFMAGIIAGNGNSSNGAWKGVAPEANLVSIKIAGADGSADVSTVIGAIQWTVSFKDRYNVRVLNLSLGSNGTQSYRTDPFNYAVERAWDAGIVVVAAASNHGPNPSTITKPGDDPFVITVGAVDDKGTVRTNDDELPNFSSRGPTAADGLTKPDLAAPGAHMISLRAPGSSIDTQFPTYIDGAYRKGSGTSMATAVVSGSVALMLQASPTMVPDRVKYALMATARNAASSNPNEVGEGVPNVYDATFAAPAGMANQGLEHSSGLGSLDASRGDVRVQLGDPLHTVPSGILTAQLLLWDPIAYTTGSGWYGSGWYGSGWYGSGWYGSGWYGSGWYGSGWYGSGWYGSGWYGSGWYGSGWYGSGWYGQPTGSGWYGSGWYGSGWYGAWS